jgi:hypothetical protein
MQVSKRAFGKSRYVAVAVLALLLFARSVLPTVIDHGTLPLHEVARGILFAAVVLGLIVATVTAGAESRTQWRELREAQGYRAARAQSDPSEASRWWRRLGRFFR